MSESFSKRHGFKPKEKKITIRHDAPEELRYCIVDIAYGFERYCGPEQLREIVCRTLQKRPDPQNWSEFPNIDNEVRNLLDGCEWYQVYDVIENIYDSLRKSDKLHNVIRKSDKFQDEINSYFKSEGIGWQLIDGKIEVRGEEGFEATIKEASSGLKESELNTASNEIHEALSDLSRRPDPDITGAVQHGMAALECVAREVCGDKKATLGEILKKYDGIIPKPLDNSIEKAWGYASEMGRHLREGRTPTFEEAELIVGMCASTSSYLLKKIK
jgi:hypothetical protein